MRRGADGRWTGQYPNARNLVAGSRLVFARPPYADVPLWNAKEVRVLCVCVCVCVCVRACVCVRESISIYLSIYLSIDLSIYLSVHLYVCLYIFFIYVSMYFELSETHMSQAVCACAPVCTAEEATFPQ